jgi:signal transduction histidine kinase/CheY-like chemotaxis protein
LKALIFTISILVIIPSSIFAIDKEEALYYNNWNDSLQDNNLMLSKAYINSNPSKALAYISQAIINTDNVLLKAKCYLQKGIIYNYSYTNKGKAALENYLLAKEIYTQNSIQNKLIITNILIGEAHINLGEQNKANLLLSKTKDLANKNRESFLMVISYLAELDVNYLETKNAFENFLKIVANIRLKKNSAYAYYLFYKRALNYGDKKTTIRSLDSAVKHYENNKNYDISVQMLIKKAEAFESFNQTKKAINLIQDIYTKSLEYNYTRGLIYSCYKLSDYFESENNFNKANFYLKYLNKIESAQGQKELTERILLAEKENKIGVERLNTKNELKFQSYLIFTGFGIALFILFIALYIFSAFKTKSKLASNLILANAKNQELKKEKDDFLAYTTHEIRTPLSAVISASEILDRTKLDSSQKEHLKALKSSASNILFLVNDILDLAKLEKRKITLEKIDFSLINVIENSISILKSKAIDNNVDIKFIQSKKVPKLIIGDAFRFQQIIINLLDNAIKYSPNGQAIIELTKEDNKSLKVVVSDNGVGIQKDKLKHIFQPYAQEKTNTSRQYGGTGLGLAICDLIIQLMNGKINVESDSSGTVFSFIIPYIISNKANVEVSASKKTGLKNIKILMAEDDELNGKLFKDLIENIDNNITLEWVKNGQEATEMTSKNIYDIILMDIEMPIKNGFETSLEIRKSLNSNNKSTPIIAMTAHLVEDVLDRCYENGINDCISKPFQIEMLYKKISKSIKIDNDGRAIHLKNKNKYLDIFIRTFKDDYDKLVEMIKQNDQNGIKSKLHKMKGSSATMEFIEIEEYISKMELKKVVDLSSDIKTLQKLFLKNTKEKI